MYSSPPSFIQPMNWDIHALFLDGVELFFLIIFCDIWELYEIQNFRVYKESFTGTEPHKPVFYRWSISLSFYPPLPPYTANWNISFLLEYNFPWISCVSTYLMSRGTHCCCSGLSVQGYLHNKQAKKIRIVFPSRARQAPIINLSGSLIPGFLIGNTTHCASRYHLASLYHPVQIGAQRTRTRKCWSLGYSYLCE